MTPTERDELARMAGARIVQTDRGFNVYYFPSSGWKSSNDWRPETSHDDCRPLLEEIERRDLWERFTWFIKLPEDAMTYSRVAQVIRFYFYMVTPADIVEAFMRTIEEADKEKP